MTIKFGVNSIKYMLLKELVKPLQFEQKMYSK